MPQTTFRRHERREWQGEVTVLGQSGMYRGHADNISETGIALALPKSFADTNVSIEFLDASGEGVLSLPAVRCHSAHGFYGFQFVSLTPEQTAALRQICQASHRAP